MNRPPDPEGYHRTVHTGRSHLGAEPSGRLRILLVIKGLATGGAERLLVDTVAAGDRDHFEYEVSYILDQSNSLVGQLTELGIPVHSLGCHHNADLRWMARLRTLVSRGNFDVVHFHLPYPAALGRLALATIPRSRRPAIAYTEHSVWDKMAVLVKAVNRAGIGLDQALIVVSDPCFDALPPALKPRAQVLVHGVNLAATDRLLGRQDEIRAEVRQELQVPDESLLVLTVANLRSEKGYDLLVAGVRLALDQELPIHVVAVGWGPIEADVRSWVHDAGLDDHLVLLGPRDDVLRLMVGSDLFVLASHQEGLPVVLMEATGAGLPIVATRVGGVPQVLTDDVDGLLVPPGDATALAAALARLANEPETRNRLAAAARERSRIFDVSEAARTIEGIYETIAPARTERGSP